MAAMLLEILSCNVLHSSVLWFSWLSNRKGISCFNSSQKSTFLDLA